MSNKIARKAVLIYPRFDGNTFWSFKRTLNNYVPKGEFGLPKRASPPLGLMGLFNYLKPYYEELVLIDRNIDQRPLKKLIKDADHVFIGGMIAQEKALIEDVKIITDLNIPVVIGGTVVHEKFPLRKSIKKKILVENESELVIDKVLKDLADKRYGKYYKSKEITPPEKFFQPDFSSINMENYITMAVQISRGCPHDCEFCDITTRFGRNPRIASWEHTEASLIQMYELGYRGSIFFVDDNFIGNPKQTIEILKKIYKLEKKIGYHFPKSTELTMRLSEDDSVMKELRYWLRKTNFTGYFIGVETNNIASLQETGKYQNISAERSIKENLRFISKETGAGVSLGMIHGFDNDTRQSSESLINFINSTNAPTVMIGLLTAAHHTKLWKRLKKEERIMEECTGNNTDGTMNFIPYNFSAKEAEEDYLKILKAIYDEKAFFKRVMRELEINDPTFMMKRVSLKKSLQFVTYFLIRLFTRENALTFLKYLPKAHSIAFKRFSSKPIKYVRIISSYLANCANFTHFKGLTKDIAKRLNHKKYEPWQLYSWKQLQESNIASVEIIEKPKPSSLYEKIRMKLDNGYEFIGTRLEALSQFIEPYLKEGMLKLRNIPKPSIKQFLDVEVKAYFEAHLKKPQILGKLNFAKVKNYLKSKIKDKPDYQTDMHNLFRSVGRTIAIKNVNSS